MPFEGTYFTQVAAAWPNAPTLYAFVVPGRYDSGEKRHIFCRDFNRGLFESMRVAASSPCLASKRAQKELLFGGAELVASQSRFDVRPLGRN